MALLTLDVSERNAAPKLETNAAPFVLAWIERIQMSHAKRRHFWHGHLMPCNIVLPTVQRLEAIDNLVICFGCCSPLFIFQDTFTRCPESWLHLQEPFKSSSDLCLKCYEVLFLPYVLV